MSFQPAVPSKDLKMLVKIFFNFKNHKHALSCSKFVMLNCCINMMEIIYFQMFSESYTYQDIRSIQGSFNVDQTLGREVAFEISYNIPGGSHLSFYVTYPNETQIEITTPSETKTTFRYEFASTLEVSY